MWAEAPVNKEAAEPFLLLSNCMLLSVRAQDRDREREDWRKRVIHLDLTGASALSLPLSLMELVSV